MRSRELLRSDRESERSSQFREGIGRVPVGLFKYASRSSPDLTDNPMVNLIVQCRINEYLLRECLAIMWPDRATDV